MPRMMGGTPGATNLQELEAALEKATAAVPEGEELPANLRQLLEMFSVVKAEKERQKPRWRSPSGKKNRHGTKR